MSNMTPPPFPPTQPPVGAGAGAAPEHGPYSFVDAIKLGFRKYATFSGRARASEYWYWVLFLNLPSFIAGGWQSTANLLTGGDNSSAGVGSGGLSSLVSLLSSLVTLALFLPSLAVAFRRLHDTGRSGVWAIVPTLLSIVAVLLIIRATDLLGVGLDGLNSPENGGSDLSFLDGAIGVAIAGVVVGLSAIVTWILLIIWTASDGGPNVPNKYGVRE